jgi:hypothetical protein
MSTLTEDVEALRFIYRQKTAVWQRAADDRQEAWDALNAAYQTIRESTT